MGDKIGNNSNFSFGEGGKNNDENNIKSVEYHFKPTPPPGPGATTGNNDQIPVHGDCHAPNIVEEMMKGGNPSTRALKKCMEEIENK